MESLWSLTAQPKSFETLQNDVKTDVLIIGGGIAGVLCAYMLKSAGVDCVLVEAERIGGGITKNTTAKITSQHGLIYDKLMREFSLEIAQMYLEANQAALAKYRELCEKIDCDFEQKDSFVYSVNDYNKLEKELTALQNIRFAAKYVKELPLPIKTAGAVCFENQAQFHPLKFLYGISEDLPIYENTKVLAFEDDAVVTSGGRVKAEKIIVATHFPILNKHGSYFLKMYQHRSYVLALRNAADVNGMYVDESLKGLSFRNCGNMLLLGGGSHRTGKQGGNWRELEKFAKQNYKNSAVEYRWATQDCMTLDSVPYIGQYSANTPNIYVATGFNKWGMTSAMVSAMLLTDMINGKKNPYTEVFSPSRTIIRPQLAVNAAEAVVNILTPTAPRCPHMGCALKYNPIEHSWDCPCHGSRFTEKGKLIDNPATDGIVITENKSPR